jgi:hypothetical protein
MMATAGLYASGDLLGAMGDGIFFVIYSPA